MAIRYENECCDCETDNYPCRGIMCPLRSVPHFYCDHCGDEVETLYHFDDQELCIDCIEKRLEIVEVEEC